MYGIVATELFFGISVHASQYTGIAQLELPGIAGLS